MLSTSPSSAPLPVLRRGGFRLLPASLAPILAVILAVTGVAWPKPPGRTGAPAKAGPAAGSSAAAPRVDSTRVHRLYLDGEFDAAIAILEDNLKETRQYSHGDSVFILKHLGVMYAAQYETREKGKYYMHRLLTVEPSARIMDMYASDMIYMIFKNIQDEFESSRRRYVRAEAQLGQGRAEPPPDPGRAEPPAAQAPSRASPRRGKSATLWVGAAAVAAAGAVALYYYSDDEPETRTVIDNHRPD